MDQPISPTAKTLERVLSKAGLGSRTDARSWIHARRVTVNGTVIENPEHWVDFDTDRVELDGRIVKPLQRLYILLYKPTGFITSKGDPEGRPTVYDLLKEVPSFVGTVGRLDEDTSGLLLLTNDTILAERMTNPEFHVPKKYLVKCASHLTDEQIEQLRAGIELNDGMTRSAEVVRVRDSGPKTFIEITITEGRNRQVRRMIEALDSKVLKLVRTELGPLKLEGLKSGNWRKLTAREVQTLYVMTKLSETAEKSEDLDEQEPIAAVGPEDFGQQDEVPELVEGASGEAAPATRDTWNKGPKVKGTKEVSLPFAGPKDSGGEKKPRSIAASDQGKGPKYGGDQRQFGDRPVRPPYSGSRDGGDSRPRVYEKSPRDFGSRPSRPPYAGPREGGDQRPRSTGSWDKGPRKFDDRPSRPPYGGPSEGGDSRPRKFDDRPSRPPYGGPREGGDSRPRRFDDRPSRPPYGGPREGGDSRPRKFDDRPSRPPYGGPREGGDSRPRKFDDRPSRPPYGGPREGGDSRPRKFDDRPSRPPYGGPREGGDSRPRKFDDRPSRPPYSGPREGGDSRPRTGSYAKGPRDYGTNGPRAPFSGPRDSGGDSRPRSFDRGPREFSERPSRPPYGGSRDGGDQRPRNTGPYNKGPRDYGTNGPRAPFSGPRDSGGDQRPRSFDKGPRDFSSRPPRPPYGGARDSGGDQRPRSTGSWDKGPRPFDSKGPKRSGPGGSSFRSKGPGGRSPRKGY